MQIIDNNEIIKNVTSLTTEAFGTFMTMQLQDQPIENVMLDVMEYRGKKTVDVYAKTAHGYYIINFWKTALQEEMGSTVLSSDEMNFLASL